MKPYYTLTPHSDFLQPDIDWQDPPGWRQFWPDIVPPGWEVALVKTQDYLTNSAQDWFKRLGIELEPDSLLFRGPPGQSVFIHSDGDKTENSDSWSQMCWGINYVWGSNDHQMLWYEPTVIKSRSELKYTNADNPYMRYQKHEVEEICRSKLSGLVVVRTDIPHSVDNHDPENVRWCLSMRPISKFKTWPEIVSHLDDTISGR